MLAAASHCLSCPADELVRTILGFRRRFVGLAPQIDDTSIVTVKLTGGPDPDCQCKKHRPGP